MDVAQSSGGRAIVRPILVRVWLSFWELDAVRRGNGYSAHAINHQDILNFQLARKVELLDWEVDAILAMDIRRLEYLHRDITPQNEPTVVSSRPFTPDLFDAVMGALP